MNCDLLDRFDSSRISHISRIYAIFMKMAYRKMIRDLSPQTSGNPAISALIFEQMLNISNGIIIHVLVVQFIPITYCGD